MNFLGKYSMIDSKNFEDYLKALGAGLTTRKLLCTAKPTIEIQQDGDEYIITTSRLFKKTEIKFKLDEEFDEETEDGRQCKSVITMDGDNKLVHTQKWDDDDYQAEIIREFGGNQMKMTMKLPNTVCTFVFTNVE